MDKWAHNLEIQIPTYPKNYPNEMHIETYGMPQIFEPDNGNKQLPMTEIFKGKQPLGLEGGNIPVSEMNLSNYAPSELASPFVLAGILYLQNLPPYMNQNGDSAPDLAWIFSSSYQLIFKRSYRDNRSAQSQCCPARQHG